MNDMIAWLNGVLDRREQLANAAADYGPEWRYSDGAVYPSDESRHPGALLTDPYGYLDGQYGEHIALNDPKQILDDVAADRAVIAMCEAAQQDAATPSAWDDTAQHVAAAMERVVRLTAAKYATWPGYQPEWAPDGSRG